jgi:hypothetical protein
LYCPLDKIFVTTGEDVFRKFGKISRYFSSEIYFIIYRILRSTVCNFRNYNHKKATLVLESLIVIFRYDQN